MSLGGDVVLGTPLIDLTQSNLVYRLLNSLLSRVEPLFLVLLLCFPHNEADLWQHDCQLQFVVLKHYEHVIDFLSVDFIAERHALCLR